MCFFNYWGLAPGQDKVSTVHVGAERESQGKVSTLNAVADGESPAEQAHSVCFAHVHGLAGSRIMHFLCSTGTAP